METALLFLFLFSLEDEKAQALRFHGHLAARKGQHSR